MSAEWFQNSIRSIVALSVLVSLVECLSDGSGQGDGLRALCCAAVAASVFSFAAGGLLGAI